MWRWHAHRRGWSFDAVRRQTHGRAMPLRRDIRAHHVQHGHRDTPGAMANRMACRHGHSERICFNSFCHVISREGG